MQYFDLQVNGYGGIDFNKDDLTADELHRACMKLREDGVESILATIITEDLDKMCARLVRLAELRDADPLAKSVIFGLHVEGPFINETQGYRGAHPADAVMPADVDAMKKLLDAGRGLVKLVTLAPERDTGMKVTSLLDREKVRISAGHTDASLDDLKRAIDAGLSIFTHLGNGCPMQMHRHDNIIQRALSLHEKLWLCFIADGVHVPFFVLGNYLRAAGYKQCVVVTDAIAPAGLGPGRYTVSRWDLLIGDDMVARAPDGSHFVGSAITMKATEKNLREGLGLPDDVVYRLTSVAPRRALRLPGLL
jgi:N-acetylglucosamine-6-phosphate deacetylase